MKKLFITFGFIFLGFWQCYAQKDIFDAARQSDVELAKKLTLINPDTLNSVDSQGYSPLILAAYHGNIDFVTFLIDNKVTFNNTQGSYTALQGVCFKGNLQAAELLLKAGANPNIYDSNGTTPLIYATQFGHTDIVNALLKNKADKSYKDLNGLTALDYAKQLNKTEIIELLD